MAHIKAYRPMANSVSSGQVLQRPYSFQEARLVAREMADALAMDLLEKGLVTDQIVLTIGYDRDNLKDPAIRNAYKGDIAMDHYGRAIPKHAHGTVRLGRMTASTRLIVDATMELFDEIADPGLLSRRINICAAGVIREEDIPVDEMGQMDLFSAMDAHQEDAELEREKRRQQALLHIRKKYGKNAIVKGMNFQEGATAMERNGQIGGHKA